MKRFTTEEFIKRAVKTHGNKYDYSNVDYINNRTKVKINCLKHGVFEQYPLNHLNYKRGCQKCGLETVANIKRFDNNKFIEKAKEIHGDKYDYSNAIYLNSRSNIEIKCKKCGFVFLQRAMTHLDGSGCSKCFRESEKYTTEEFIEKAKEIHGDKYDYSKTIYTKSTEKVVIYCNKCKIFFNQQSLAHMKGQGCSKCKSSKGENIIKEFLIKNNIQFETQKKFQGCKNKRMLSYDFYLTKLNKLIEFDGAQHFIPIKAWSGLEGLKRTKINDEIKNKFAKEKNIELIRISYTNLSNLNKILEEKLIDKTI